MLEPSKLKWAGHAARAKHNWALDIMKWNPIGKRKRRTLKTCWARDLVKHSGNNWAEVTEERDLWSNEWKASSSSGTEAAASDDESTSKYQY